MTIFRNIFSIFIIGLTKSGRKAWQETEATREKINIVMIRQDKKFLISELFKVIQDAVSWILFYRTMSLFRTVFFKYIYHVGCALNLHSIINSGLIPGGQNLSKRKRTVFFLPVNPLDKEHRDPDTIDLEAPRLARNMHQAWKKHQNTVYWVDINLALKKGLKFYQTRSNAIILHETFPATCIPKVVRMEIGEVCTRRYMRHLVFLQRFP